MVSLSDDWKKVDCERFPTWTEFREEFPESAQHGMRNLAEWIEEKRAMRGPLSASSIPSLREHPAILSWFLASGWHLPEAKDSTVKWTCTIEVLRICLGLEGEDNQEDFKYLMVS